MSFSFWHLYWEEDRSWTASPDTVSNSTMILTPSHRLCPHPGSNLQEVGEHILFMAAAAAAAFCLLPVMQMVSVFQDALDLLPRPRVHRCVVRQSSAARSSATRASKRPTARPATNSNAGEVYGRIGLESSMAIFPTAKVLQHFLFLFLKWLKWKERERERKKLSYISSRENLLRSLGKRI